MIVQKPLNNKRGTRRGRAQAMIEFALVIPVLLMIMVGLLEFGRLLFGWLVIENSTRFGIRYATAGSYDLKYCNASYTPVADAAKVSNGGDGTPDCDGASKAAEILAARLPSIKDETKRIIAGLHFVEGVPNTNNDFLKVTVCSRDDFNFPYMAQPVYASCKSGVENAGAPGENVWVATDYNFTFIVLPIFSKNTTGVHLASYRFGSTELFKAAKIVNAPAAPQPSGCLFNQTCTPTPTNTSTPTKTSTPTASNTPRDTDTPTTTFTPTKTPTPTNTPKPLYIAWEANTLALNGQTLTNASQTTFQAIAYDPAIGTNNGNGIKNIIFKFPAAPTNPTTITNNTDKNVPYCAFLGATCDPMPNFDQLLPGTYTMTAQATASDGIRKSPIITLTFKIAAPAPLCSLVTASDAHIVGDNVEVDLRNNNLVANAYLKTASISWTPNPIGNTLGVPNAFDFAQWNGQSAYWDPANITNSPASHDPTANTLLITPKGNAANGTLSTWAADFTQSIFLSRITVNLTVNLPDGSICSFTSTIDYATVTPIPPTATITFTPTPIPPTKTFTPIPPTKTFTPILPTNTFTPILPTNTPTQTKTPTPSPTNTPYGGHG